MRKYGTPKLPVNMQLKKIRNALPTFILLAIFIALFWGALRELFIDWQIDPNYQHGFLIPLISIYLIWQKRDTLRQLALQPSYTAGLCLIGAALGLFLVATAGAEWFLARAAMLLCLIGLAVYFGGKNLLRAIWFPLLYLGFMIPLPYVIYYRLTFPLQQLASFGAFHTMQLFGIPGLREGNILHFTGFSLEVIEACSGLRSMMVLMALGAIVAYMATLSNSRRWLLFLATIPIAVAANVLRLVFIANLGIFWSAEAARSFLHEGSGLLVFLSGLFLLLMFAGVLQWFNSRKRIGLSLV